jgi:hypothetical protein
MEFRQQTNYCVLLIGLMATIMQVIDDDSMSEMTRWYWQSSSARPTNAWEADAWQIFGAVASNLIAAYLDSRIYFSCSARDQLGHRAPRGWGFLITYTNTHTWWDSSGRVISSSQISRHATNTTDKHPCPQRGLNPRSQQSGGCRPTP